MANELLLRVLCGLAVGVVFHGGADFYVIAKNGDGIAVDGHLLGPFGAIYKCSWTGEVRVMPRERFARWFPADGE